MIARHYDFRNYSFFLLLFLSVLFCPKEKVVAQNYPFNIGETLDYNLYFKYGIIMAKAGTADYTIRQSTANGAALSARLTFRTSSTFDRIFKIRDTLVTYQKSDLTPILHKKYLHEGKTEYVETMNYLSFGNEYTKVRSIRQTPGGNVKFDTLLVANQEGHDMLNIFMFVRQIDYSSLKEGNSSELVCFVGLDIVKLRIFYRGKKNYEDGGFLYKTLKFDVDVVDKTFAESKRAIEIWVSDDENHIPIRIKAKLKIGNAEAKLASAKDLKYPFSSKRLK